jgi:3-oxoacyl-[acyl-carrier-protein] synthase-1
VDSYIDADTLDWIEANEQLHTPSNAWGFIPGEAAAFCLLCTTATANRHQLPVRARLVSSASATEPNRIKTETVCIGQGLTEAVRAVVQFLPENIRIDQTYCDQNGEAYRADEYGFMLARLSEYFVDPSEYVAPADCWGDVGAASGLLFVNLLCAAAEKGYSTGFCSLLWASSEGGDRAAAILMTGESV